MTEKLSRRSFFRLAGGGIAAAVIAPKLLLDKVINIPVEFGWTWFVDKSKIPPTLSKLVTATLRDNAQTIANNITTNNSLLMKLKDGTKVNLQIENIGETAQNERMKIRMQKRLEEKEASRIAHIKKTTHLDENNTKWIEERSKTALSNQNIWRIDDDMNQTRKLLEQKKKDIVEGRAPHPFETIKQWQERVNGTTKITS